MPGLNDACSTCNAGIQTVFAPGSGTRQSETIAGDLLVSDQCFIRDEIRFLNTGRLIFVPAERVRYHREYFVICRKLTIVGGHKPGQVDPCGPDDPGKTYNANNVITWQDRLTSATGGAAPSPLAAPDTQPQSNSGWTSNGNPNGNSGRHGDAGPNGQSGSAGAPGRDAPSFTLVVLDVEAGAFGDHLTIDFDGQVGGSGGRGQNGGAGGWGMNGREGQSDTSWPGTGCDRQPGNGGNGGPGGQGGQGGPGGAGGRAGNIEIVTTSVQLTNGPLVNGNVTFVNDGGSGGNGGLGGIGGRGGRGGKRGFRTSECDEANDGVDGLDGDPPGIAVGPGSNANPGPAGAHGGSGVLKFVEVAAGSCADIVPLPIQAGSVSPSVLCRGFSTPAIVDASLSGTNLGQVTGVNVTGLANITVTILPTSTDTQLNLRFDIAGNSGLGAGGLTLSRVFGGSATLANAVTVQRFQVTSLSPSSGARGSQVSVQIQGQCFDPSALLQQVVVSGLGVNAVNMIVVSAQQVQCVFDINPNAPTGARSVTVKTGVFQHTLLSAFTVT